MLGAHVRERVAGMRGYLDTLDTSDAPVILGLADLLRQGRGFTRFELSLRLHLSVVTSNRQVLSRADLKRLLEELEADQHSLALEALATARRGRGREAEGVPALLLGIFASHPGGSLEVVSPDSRRAFGTPLRGGAARSPEILVLWRQTLPADEDLWRARHYWTRGEVLRSRLAQLSERSRRERASQEEERRASWSKEDLFDPWGRGQSVLHTCQEGRAQETAIRSWARSGEWGEVRLALSRVAAFSRRRSSDLALADEAYEELYRGAWENPALWRAVERVAEEGLEISSPELQGLFQGLLAEAYLQRAGWAEGAERKALLERAYEADKLVEPSAVAPLADVSEAWWRRVRLAGVLGDLERFDAALGELQLSGLDSIRRRSRLVAWAELDPWTPDLKRLPAYREFLAELKRE